MTSCSRYPCPGLVPFAICFFSFIGSAVPVQASFNFEIQRRVVDAIHNFFGVPEDMVLILNEYRTNGGFASDMAASDRDAFGAIAYSLRSVSAVDMIYYGAEDGVFMGYVQRYLKRGYVVLILC